MTEGSVRLRKKGFTLLEILVASVIGAFVMITATGSFMAVTASREKIDGNLTATSEIRFVADMIRRDLTNLYRDKETKNVLLIGTQQVMGDGPTSVLVLYTVGQTKARPGRAESDVYEVEYSLHQKEEKTLLMRRLEPYPYKKEEMGGVSCAVAENIIAFEVRFLDGEHGEWVTEWSQENETLPELVEVNLVSKAPEQNNIVTNSFLVTYPRWPQKTQESNNESNGNDNGSSSGSGSGNDNGSSNGNDRAK